MAEYIREVTVHIEVDTNKRTHVLETDAAGIKSAKKKIAKFFDEVMED